MVGARSMQRFLQRFGLTLGLLTIFWSTTLPGSVSYAHPTLPEEVMEFMWANPRASDAEIDAFLRANPEHDVYDTRDMMTMLRDLTDEQLQQLNAGGIQTGQNVPWYKTLGMFIWQGILHIVGGPDHVLFVLSLLLIPLAFWRLVKLLTAFTVAHSITLLLAGFGIVNVDSYVVEPLIALSIVVTSLSALMYYIYQKRMPAHNTMLIVFLFGLLHGLGFASVFGDLGVTGGNLVVPLLGFNVGVELGQIAIVLVALPLVKTLMEQSKQRWVLITTCVLFTTVALYWFISRILS